MVGTLSGLLVLSMLVTRCGDRTAINNFERDEGSTRREKQRLVKVSQLFLSETVSGRNLKACRQIRRLIGSSNSSLVTAHCYANEVSRHTNPSNFGMMKVNSGHHSGHPNRNIRYYDSEGNDDDIGEGGEPILGELSYPNKSSAVLRVKSVECSA